MKLPPILTGIVLDPVAGTLDFSALGAGFDPRTVLAVLHEPTNRFIFAKGRSGLGYASIAGSVMTLAANTTGLATGPLTGFRDDGALIATDARLEACRALLATANATLSNIATGLGTPSDVAPGSDAATGSLIAKVTRLLGTQTGIATVLAAIRDRLPAALVGGRLSVDGSGVVQPVTVGNFPATQPVSGTVSLGAGAAQIGTIGNAFALDATLQGVATSNAAISTATGAPTDVATAGGTSTSIIGALRAIRDKLLGTLTVSGTVTSNQGAAGAAAWKVDGSGVTQPISAAALPLPTGAATDALLGTVNTSITSLSTATGTTADAATASGANTSVIGALRAIRDRLLGTLTSAPADAPAATAFSFTAVGSTAWIDTTGYAYLDVDLSSFGSGNSVVVQYQGSGGAANTAVTLFPGNLPTGGLLAFQAVPSSGLTRVPVQGKLMRLSVAIYGSGTVAGTLTLRANGWSPNAAYVTGGQVNATLGSVSSPYVVATTTLSTSAQQIVAAGSLTNQRTIKNTDASITIYLGPSGVTASNGYPLKPGETITFDARNTSAALFAVAASGTPVVSAIGF